MHAVDSGISTVAPFAETFFPQSAAPISVILAAIKGAERVFDGVPKAGPQKKDAASIEISNFISNAWMLFNGSSAPPEVQAGIGPAIDGMVAVLNLVNTIQTAKKPPIPTKTS